MTLNKIMVILDPTQEQQPAYDRALESAHMTGARLHIYACLGNGQQEEASPANTKRLQTLLEQSIDHANSQGVETTGELEWADDWRRQAVSAAARCSASMIFKTYVPHDEVQRQIRTTYDWTLLRLAPCPVLLVKNNRDWKHRRVLAAVYSDAVDEAHQKLNNQIVSFAQRFSDAYGSEAHIVSAYQDRNQIPAASDLAATCGVAEAFVHVGEGKPADVIRDTADQLDADLILIGTVGRSGIKGTVVGNTSERLLDRTRSDVLVLN
ncbi:MAG: universal stress protein [Halieaceae bacterium]